MKNRPPKRNKTLLLLGLFLLIVCFTCHPRTVVRKGVKMPYDEAARLDFREAEETYATGKQGEAIASLKKNLKNYPNSGWADDVNAKLGDIYLAQGKYQEASVYYRTVLEDFFFSDLKTHSGFRLGICFFSLEKYQDAAQALVGVANRFTDPIERLEIYTLITRSYENSDQPIEALPYYVSMVRIYKAHELGQDLQTPYTKIPSSEYVEGRVIEIIVQTENKSALRKTISFYGDAFPAQYALLRLAKLQIEEERSNLAESNLEELLRRFPSDPLANESRSLLKRIQSRYLVNENHIGVILPLTGKTAPWGIQTLQGIELAVSLMHDNYPQSEIQFFIRDSQGNPERAAQLVSDLVLEEQVIAIIGPLVGSTSASAGKEAQAVGVPLITLSSAQTLADIGPYIFQNALLPQNEVRSLIQYAMKTAHEDKERSKKFALLYPNNWFGISMRDAFWDEVKKQGGQIVGCEMYQAQATDFKSEVSKLVGLYYRDPREGEWKEAQRKAKEKRRNVRDARPEPYIDFGSIFIPADYKKATLIADHLPLYDIEDVLILGNSTWNNPDLPQRSQHVNGAIFTDGFYPHSKRDQTSTFVANFHSTFEEDPHRLAAYAFDSAEILINLLQDPRNQSRETLQNALLQLKNYEGATGRFSFAENGEVLKEPFLLKVEKRKIVEAQESEGS